MHALILSSGVIVAFPLLLFAHAARRIRLATLGGPDGGLEGAARQSHGEGPRDGGDACKEPGHDSGDHCRRATRSGSDASWVKAAREGDRVDVRCGVVLRVWRWGRATGGGCAGPALRSQGSAGEPGLSRCARGMRVIASGARSGPVPLALGTRPSIGVWMDVVSGPS